MTGGDYLGLTKWAQYNHMSPKKQTTSLDTVGLQKLGRTRKIDSPPMPPEGKKALPTPWFSSSENHADRTSDAKNCKTINLGSFSPLSLW